MHFKRTLLTASLLLFTLPYPSLWQANTSYDKENWYMDATSLLPMYQTLYLHPQTLPQVTADLLSTAPGNESSDPIF